jgi:hypothetical protein
VTEPSEFEEFLAPGNGAGGSQSGLDVLIGLALAAIAALILKMILY